MEGRRHHYHVVYEDGDEEDYDFAELNFAVELQKAFTNGTYIATSFVDKLSDGEGSVHVPSEKDSEDSSEEMVENKVTRKRISKGSLRQGGEPLAKRNKTTKDVAPKKAATSKMKHTT